MRARKLPVKYPLSLAALTLGSFVSPAANASEGDELPPLPAAQPAAPAAPRNAVEAAPPEIAGATAPPKFPARFELRVAGGPAYKTLLGLPMTMGSFDLAMGARVGEMVAFHVSLDGDFGRTRHGLMTRQFTLTPSVELVADRFRLGFGPEVTWFGIWRATTGAVVAHGGVGFRVSPSFDIIKSDSGSIYIAARGQIDWLFAGGLFSVTGLAGVRF